MFLPVKAVLIRESKDDLEEIILDISPGKNEIYHYLKGGATFIGQWADKEVVIMKCHDSIFKLSKNENILPIPFNLEVVFGPILLIRMDKNAYPQDFTLKEYRECMPHPSKPRQNTASPEQNES
jgi:hypothetical protein